MLFAFSLGSEPYFVPRIIVLKSESTVVRTWLAMEAGWGCWVVWKRLLEMAGVEGRRGEPAGEVRVEVWAFGSSVGWVEKPGLSMQSSEEEGGARGRDGSTAVAPVDIVQTSSFQICRRGSATEGRVGPKRGPYRVESRKLGGVEGRRSQRCSVSSRARLTTKTRDIRASARRQP